VTGSREIYPNASVALVAVEARHTVAPQITPEQEARLKELLAPEFPLHQPVPTLSFNIGMMGEAAPSPSAVNPPRFTNRSRTMAATFTQQSMVIETTEHEHFDRLAELIALTVSARQAVSPVDGLERLGLRYIDEIRVPSDVDEIDWSQWVTRSLLGPTDVAQKLSFPTGEHQGLVGYQFNPNRALTLRYGVRLGHAVQSAALVRKMPPPSPFFLLDIDSFWMATEEIPEFNQDRILSICHELHNPVNDLFEALITERLRVEVLRNA
jgi:uncharacterized protein (TIGR04255 family)